MKILLQAIVKNKTLHGKWLNTLSYLENCGARLIAACEHPTLVKEEMLKHAAEEFRHAHHLKKQICKISARVYPSYEPSSLLGGMMTLQYLKKLNLYTCRYLKEKRAAKELSYLLVTYAIELRAEALYPLYDKELSLQGSRVGLRAILLEEKEHLAEMRAGLEAISLGMAYAEKICQIEESLYKTWIRQIEKDVADYDDSLESSPTLGAVCVSAMSP